MFASPSYPDPTAPPVDQSAVAGPAVAGPVRPGPGEALALLRAGNARYAHGTARSGGRPAPASARSPYAVVLSCLDARVPVEAIFDQELGAICVVRSAGHILDRAVLASVEFTVTDFTVPLLVVLGHDDCRAIVAAMQAVRTGRRAGGTRGFLLDEIAPAAVDAGTGEAALGAVTRAHVRRTVDRLAETAAVAEAVRVRRLAVVGAVYHLDTGDVEVL